MNASYVCRTCVRWLTARSRPLGTRVQLRRAGFISLSRNRTTGNASVAESTTGGRNGTQQPVVNNKARPRSRVDGQHQPRDTAGFLEGLFSSTQHQTAEPPNRSRSRYSRLERAEIPEDATPLHSRHDLLTTWVDKLSGKRAPLEEQWAAFVQLYGSKHLAREHPTSGSERDWFKDGDKFRDLLLHTVRGHIARLRNRKPELPAPAEAIRLYLQADLMKDYVWAKVLWILLGAIVKLKAGISKEGWEKDSPQYSTFSENLLSDTLEVWQVFMETFGAKSSGFPSAVSQETPAKVGSAQIDTSSGAHTSLAVDGSWKGLPATPVLVAARHSLPNLPDRFLSFLPRHRGSSYISHISTAAVMTFDLLCPNTHRGKYRALSAYEKDFVWFLANVISNTSLDFDHARQYLTVEKVPPDIIDKIMTGWKSLPQRIAAALSLAEGSNAIAASPPSIEYKIRRPLSGSPKIKSTHLTRAVSSGDVKAIDGFWLNVQPELSRDMVDEHIFAQFLWAYMAVRRPNQATHVWNKMVELGREPSQNHWFAMLRGCHQARDYAAMQDIWEEMAKSGVRPALRCWTMRIQGLIRSGQWQQGLKALDELSKIWDPAAVPAGGAPKPQPNGDNDHLSHTGGELYDPLVPSMVPVNAAITSLIAIKEVDAIGTCLQWAESHNIQPDTTTFNILLRRAVRGNQPHDARNILQQMETADCQPDIHTFTIILDGLFHNSGIAFNLENPEAQVAAVSDIFRQMKAAGIVPSPLTYGTMLDGLLGPAKWSRPKQLNVAAARAVLDHMAVEGIKPSRHIYTILISHYFALDPPDLASIDALWERMQLEGTTADHIFYDRIIEGYARIGAVEKMLTFLRRMPKEGKFPGWVALRAVLRSLVRVEHWEAVRDLVKDVGDKDGVFRNASRLSWAKKDFWDTVYDLRLKGIELPAVEEDIETET